MKEKNVENKIKKYLDSIGAWHVKIHGNMYTKSGTPDILACYQGRFIAIEVKKESGGVVSELQKFKINQIKQAGGVAIVATSLDQVKHALSISTTSTE